MTNARIILLQRNRLLREGVIGSAGIHRFKDYKGVPYACDIPEDIFTMGAWRKRGYRIKPGETARARFPIWRYRIDHSTRPPKKTYYMKNMDFFTADQVTPFTDTEAYDTAI